MGSIHLPEDKNRDSLQASNVSGMRGCNEYLRGVQDRAGEDRKRTKGSLSRGRSRIFPLVPYRYLPSLLWSPPWCVCLPLLCQFLFHLKASVHSWLQFTHNFGPSWSRMATGLSLPWTGEIEHYKHQILQFHLG